MGIYKNIMSISRNILCVDVGLLGSNAVWTFSDLKIEAVFFSEALGSIYKSTRRYCPKDQYRHLHCREILRYSCEQMEKVIGDKYLNICVYISTIISDLLPIYV
jgi:hypothetical protein